MTEIRVICWGLLNLCIVFGLSAQQAGHLDLSQAVKDFYTQKNLGEQNRNFQALPLLASKSKVAVRFDENRFALTLGSHTEFYMLLELTQDLSNDNFILTSSAGQQPIVQKDFSERGRLLAGPFIGDIEMTASQLENEIPFYIRQIYIPPVNTGAMELGFKASYECHININCDEGSSYEQEKNGVMRIRMVAEEGVALCTGTLLNNTAGNKDPIVLTAFHCINPAEGSLTPFYDMWLFDFNYESRSCANPDEEPIPLVLEGAELLAQWEDTDMLLVRILDSIPEHANIYFNGWDRRANYEPQPTVLIHHPAGDIMKITTDNEPVIPFDNIVRWNNGTETSPGSHFINDFDDSVYQPGSSGAGLFDETGKVIGQLHGGPLSDELCEIGIGYSGRLSQSWNTGPEANQRLKEWLDPDDTGAIFVEGIPANSQDQAVQFEGSITTASGVGIADVNVKITGDLNATFQTGSDGRFLIDLTTNGSYVVTFEKDTNVGNGISATDLVSIQNHILGDRFIDDVFGRFAADVNQDDKITVADILEIINLIVGKTSEFRNTQSWNFEPGSIELNGSNVGSGSFNLDVIGFKMGDVNESADPKF